MTVVSRKRVRGVGDGMQILNCGFEGYVGEWAFPPAELRFQMPEMVERLGRGSGAGYAVRGEREKKESVKEYFGRGRSCWAAAMV